MKIKILLVVTGVVLLAAGCGKSSAPAAVNSQVPAPVANNADAGTKGQGSFKDLLALGKSLKCDTSFTSQGNTSTGTMYISGGQMRGDFSSQVSGKVMQMHMVLKDQTSYSWVEGAGQTMGFKSAMAPNGTDQNNTAKTNTVDANQQVTYNCQNWSNDSTEFDLPAGVTFSETSTLLTPKAPVAIPPIAPGGSVKSQQCAACNSAPASAKAQCLAALGCN
jgi:hypothetical protein